MPDPSDLKSNSQKMDDGKNTVTGGVSSPVKEKEPAKLQNAEVGQIREIASEDEAMETEIKSVLEDAKLAFGEPKIPQDLRQAGVKSPQNEASNVIAQGSSLKLAITEEGFKKGEHAKFWAHVNERKDVLGVSSIIAFAMLVGRLIKLAHKHTIGKIIFKGKEDKNAN